MGKSSDILAVLHKICQTYPRQAAVVEGDAKVLTYKELWRQALQVAGYIRSHGSVGQFIGLHLPKSSSYIVSMIGCWMAGKAFVPIGTDLPAARREYITAHADIHLILDAKTYEEAMAHRAATETATCEPSHIAYMIYSSGTTGTPKGIVVSHAGLCNLARCQQRAFGVDHPSRYLFFLSVNFDASISDILVTLTSGAALVIEPVAQEELASNLFKVIAQRRVTHTDIPPSLLKMLQPEDCPDCLQTIVIGGEPADIETVRRWSQSVCLVNVYGPTEATVCTSLCQCDAQWNAPLLGNVIDHTHYSVYADGRLDANEGELWISGIGLAIGYHKDKELTDRKFPVIDGVRYYRTSDHVRKTHDNQLEFIGRIDRQVKFHGQLIELEEIEHTLRGNRHVSQVAVVKRKVDARNDKDAIVAFIQLMHDGMPPTDAERQLRQNCKNHLPKWMMPSFFEFVDQMPVTPSGKPDLHALSSIPLSKNHREESHEYSSEEEKAIASAMADILKLPSMGADDDFFLLGGDSLDTILLLARLQQYGMPLTPTEIRNAPTPRLLAQSRRPDTAMCIHSSQLERHWQMPFTPATPQPEASRKPGVVLITGTTGFLGSHLLFEMLSRRPSLRVKCLIRCPSPEAGWERMCDTFRRYQLDTRLLSHVEVVCGDISKPRLGWDDDTYKTLSEEVSEVFHCAAAVNMLANYEQLKDANVTGTRNIIDFCLSGKRKRLHYASTLSVFVSTDRNSGTAYENDHLCTPTYIYGGYGQTKYVAEKMVLGIDPSLCDVFIYRFGLLCGDTEHSISAPKDFLGMFFRGARTVGCLPYDPSEAMAVDITPINLAAGMVADIANRNNPDVYHIAGEKPLQYNPLCTLMKEEGVINDIVAYEQWKETVGSFSDDVDVQALRMALCRMDDALFTEMRYMDLFQTTGIRFDMTNTHVATGIRCTHDRNLIKRYIRQSYEAL